MTNDDDLKTIIKSLKNASRYLSFARDFDDYLLRRDQQYRISSASDMVKSVMFELEDQMNEKRLKQITAKKKAVMITD